MLWNFNTFCQVNEWIQSRNDTWNRWLKLREYECFTALVKWHFPFVSPLATQHEEDSKSWLGNWAADFGRFLVLVVVDREISRRCDWLESAIIDVSICVWIHLSVLVLKAGGLEMGWGAGILSRGRERRQIIQCSNHIKILPDRAPQTNNRPTLCLQKWTIRQFSFLSNTALLSHPLARH